MSSESRETHLLPVPRLRHPLPDKYDDPVAALVQPARDVEQPLASLVGVPFDTTTLGRRGSKYGPGEIRRALSALLCYDPGFGVDLADARPVADHGDVDVVQTDVTETWRRISVAVSTIAELGAPLIVLGGDHGLTFPVVRGLANVIDGQIGVISVDAHFDVRISHQGQISAGVPFRYLLEQLPDRVQGQNLVQIGIGAWRNSAGYAKYLADVGARVISARELRRGDHDRLIQEAIGRASNGTVGMWLSIDIDGIDGAAAPGTGTPAIAGMTSHQLLELCWSFGLQPNALGIDLVEVSPPQDVASMTAMLAATALVTFAAGCHRRLGGSLV